MKATILQKIIEQKKVDLEARKANLPLIQLQRKTENSQIKTASFFKALITQGPALIAEIKRVSPSKGPLRPELDPIDLAHEYQTAGAKAISVLTEEKFFGGSDEDLQAVKANTQVPILRKDFTIDAYQIYEAKQLGASAILLIANILSNTQLKNFSELAQKLGLDVLLEVHNRDELQKALATEPKIIGVNNRNLHTFEVNLQTSFDLIQEFNKQTNAVWVSESGIYEKEQIISLQKVGYKAFLIGESLLKAERPADKLRELIS
jgi:indole-3-glycerol phosphate synthase